jgi:hypothetical protein
MPCSLRKQPSSFQVDCLQLIPRDCMELVRGAILCCWSLQRPTERQKQNDPPPLTVITAFIMTTITVTRLGWKGWAKWETAQGLACLTPVLLYRKCLSSYCCRSLPYTCTLSDRQQWRRNWESRVFELFWRANRHNTKNKCMISLIFSLAETKFWNLLH